MDPQDREEFENMKNRIRQLEQLFDDAFGGKPEGLGQIVVSQVVVKTPSAARVLRVKTTQGDYNILAE